MPRFSVARKRAVAIINEVSRSDRPRVVIIDDSQSAVELVSTALESVGYEAHGFTSVFSAPGRVDELKPAIIIIDLMMPALPGDKVVGVLRRCSDHRCPVVLLSTVEESELRARAEACGAEAYVRKGRDFTTLLSTVQRCLSSFPQATT